MVFTPAEKTKRKKKEPGDKVKKKKVTQKFSQRDKSMCIQ